MNFEPATYIAMYVVSKNLFSRNSWRYMTVINEWSTKMVCSTSWHSNITIILTIRIDFNHLNSRYVFRESTNAVLNRTSIILKCSEYRIICDGKLNNSLTLFASGTIFYHIAYMTYIPLPVNISWWFAKNSEVFVSEFIKNPKDFLFCYYIHVTTSS